MGLYGSWYKLQSHLAGRFPYLEEIGTLHGSEFKPRGGVLPHKISYGAICELVQLKCKEQGRSKAKKCYARVNDRLVHLRAGLSEAFHF